MKPDASQDTSAHRKDEANGNGHARKNGRLSLHPLKFEDVLRALVETPPKGKGQQVKVTDRTDADGSAR